MRLYEALEQDLNIRMKNVETLITKQLYKYLIKVMPYHNKSGNTINIMLNNVYNKLEDKNNIKRIIKKIAKDNGGTAKSLNDDSVIKIYFEE